jgi:membrane protein required for colicin V production
MNLNWLDFVIIAAMLISVLAAVRKGFSREVIGLVAAFAGLVLGLWFYGTAGGWLQPYVSSVSVAHFLGFLIVFLGVIIVGALLSTVVSRFLRTVGLSLVDRALGAAFGITRGLVVSVALVMILVAFAPGSTAATPPPAVVNSRLAPYVIGTSRIITQFAPFELKDEFHKRYDQIRHAWDDKRAAQVSNPRVSNP